MQTMLHAYGRVNSHSIIIPLSQAATHWLTLARTGWFTLGDENEKKLNENKIWRRRGEAGQEKRCTCYYYYYYLYMYTYFSMGKHFIRPNIAFGAFC